MVFDACRWVNADGAPIEGRPGCLAGALFVAMPGTPVERVAAIVRQREGLDFGLAHADPERESAAVIVERAVAQGLAGITLSPHHLRLRLTHERVVDLFERCAAADLVVHLATPPGACGRARAPLSFTSVFALDEALDALSGGAPVVLLGDAGGHAPETLVRLLERWPGCLVELSALAGAPWRTHRLLTTMYEAGLTDRLLMASGAPASTTEDAIAGLYDVNWITGSQAGEHRVPREVIRSIVERDGARALGVDGGARRAVLGEDRSRAGAAWSLARGYNRA
jgi:predicted TIM-barrel fold metal-dependent hydrolase